MPTAVLDLEFEKLPPEINGLDRYSHAFILIRLHGHPVGQVLLPVTNGHISDWELRNTLIDSSGWPLWRRWIYNYLGWDETHTSKPTPTSATIAVCTRDRPDDIQRCLDGIIKLNDKNLEILVIDNCPSTDATHRIVESYEGVRYVIEKRPGLNVARNRALREAKYEIVAFTDDDATPDHRWLRNLLHNFADPLVLCVTGLTMPDELETEAQEWFQQYSPFGRGYNRSVFTVENLDPLVPSRVGSGVNMALRRSVLNLVGPFDEALDVGTSTCSGGDTEMFSRILASGYRIVYDPAALNWHHHRRTWKELRKAIYGYGVGVYAFWTRRLIFEYKLGVIKHACLWFFRWQLPALIRSLLKRPGSSPLDLIWAELRGCAAGPWAYINSRKQLRINKTLISDH